MMKDKFASSDLISKNYLEVRSSQPPSKGELISNPLACRMQKSNDFNLIISLFVRVFRILEVFGFGAHFHADTFTNNEIIKSTLFGFCLRITIFFDINSHL